MTTMMREIHAEAIQLGAECPYDCAACESRGNRHEHTFTCCSTRQTCESAECMYDDETPWDGDARTFTHDDCTECIRARIVGRVRNMPTNGRPLHLLSLPLWLDPWTNRVITAAECALIPF